MAEEAGAPFDLARGPLIRGRLVRIGDDDHVLLITMHHIVSDGWSMGVLTRELGALYGAFRAGRPDPLPPLAVQYADYAAWQRRWVEGEVLREQAEYWQETLAGAPGLLELPTDHARPARQDFTGATVGLVLDEALSAALKELSRRHGTTLFMTLLAGWAAVLSRLSGQDEVVVGTPTANRGREEIEGLIGFFVNMLPVRVDAVRRADGGGAAGAGEGARAGRAASPGHPLRAGGGARPPGAQHGARAALPGDVHLAERPRRRRRAPRPRPRADGAGRTAGPAGRGRGAGRRPVRAGDGATSTCR